MMTKDANLTLHGVTSVTTRCVWINGSWHREIICQLGDDGDQEFKFVLCGESRLALRERSDEWVRVGDSDPRVERSDKPFGESPSANEGAKP